MQMAISTAPASAVADTTAEPSSSLTARAGGPRFQASTKPGWPILCAFAKGGIPNSGPLETLTLLFSSRGAPLTVKRMPNGLQALLRRRSFAFSRLQAGAGTVGMEQLSE